nr:D-2-hydroxyacid dehydrogenase [Endozoicomonas sp. OPT23]
MKAFEDLPVSLEVYEITFPADVAERVKGAAAIFTNKVVLGRELLEANPQLRYIGVLATGMNNIDLAACSELGIKVQNVERYSTSSVAQHSMALILSLANAMPANSANTSNGQWAKSDMFCLLNNPMMELAGRKLLIIGYGDLGKATAKLAEAFGMEILKAKIPGSISSASDRVDLEKGLAEADIVSLHCPLTERTQNLINTERLALMKPTALLINTARGGLVDEQALVEVLKAGKLGGAGFDVLTEEPPVNGNILLENPMPNLIVTPHCAWGSLESRQRLVNQAVESYQHFLG